MPHEKCTDCEYYVCVIITPNTNSLSFQICDLDMEILSINARYGGSANDSFIWNNSYIKDLLKEEYANGSRNSFLLGIYNI